MKKITFWLLLVMQNNFAQNTFPLPSGNVGIGTNTPTVPLDVIGTVKIQSSNTNYSENLRLLPSLTNDYSGIAIGAVNGNSGTGIGQWTLIRYPASSNYMFSLRYNTTDFLNIFSNGNVGIGTNSPTSKLDVGGTIKSFEATALGSPLGSMQLINEIGGSCGIGNRIYSRSWIYRDNTSEVNWFTTRLHDGISIDGTYATPQTNTRTWWERDPYDNIQSWGNASDTYLTINKGNIGIGIISPANKLDVNGTIHSKEVKVDMNGWSDFVFKKEYSLPTLVEVEKHIAEKGHLENIPSEEEVLKNGINLGEMNSKLLQKIEELTLYIIEQDKKITDLKNQNENFKVVFERLSKIEEKLN